MATLSPPQPQLSSCETSAIYYASSIPCSGHGVCANFTIASTSRSMCVCDYGWNGGADMFDMRIGMDPLTGVTMSLDCSVSAAGTIVVWSLLLVFSLHRTFENVRCLHEMSSQKKRPTKLSQLFKEVRYRSVIVDLLTICPLIVSTSLMKIATAFSPTPFVLGTYAPLTVTLVIGVFCGLVTVSDFLSHQLEILVKSQIDHAGSRERVLSLSRRLTALTLSSYLMLSVVPALVTLSLDKSLGPIQNDQYVIIVVRNVGIVGWQVFQLLGSRYLVKETRAIKAFLVPSRNGETGGVQGSHSAPTSPKSRALLQGGPSTDRMASIIMMMEHRSRNLTKTNVVVGTVYAVFCIPQLFAQQTYLLGGLTSLGMLTSPARILHKIAEASNGATKKSSQSALATTPHHHHTQPQHQPDQPLIILPRDDASSIKNPGGNVEGQRESDHFNFLDEEDEHGVLGRRGMLGKSEQSTAVSQDGSAVIVFTQKL